MDPRQLIRVGAVVVAALALAFLGWRTASDDPDQGPAAAAGADLDGTAYEALVVDLQSLLTAYAPLQGVTDHDQVHLARQELAGVELALRQVEQRAADADADDVIELSATVRSRAVAVLTEGAADHSDDQGGVAVVQAFGRETALRALRIGEAVRRVEQDGWGPVVEAVRAPWPEPEEEGLDDAVPEENGE